MSTPIRQLEATRKDQGEHLVTINPTTATAESMASGLIYALGKDTALLSRFVSAAVNPGHEISAARRDTATRLAKILRRVTEVDLTVDEADVLADDIHDAIIPLPPCDTDGCSHPEHHQGLCWDHLAARQVAVQGRTARAVRA